MNKFYLIRHGEKIGEAGDMGLTKLGRSQAEKTAKYLSDKEISKMYSSTYKRTVETAKIIDDILKVGTELDDRLRERMNWGSILGQSLEEFLKEWDLSKINRTFEPKAGISSFKAGKNAQDVIDAILKKYPNENVAVITHGGVVTDLLKNLFSHKELEKIKDDLQDEKIKECSVTILIKDENKYFLEGIGLTSHL